MKCIKRITKDGEERITRVSDERAATLVRSGEATYCPKWEWKEKVRDKGKEKVRDKGKEREMTLFVYRDNSPHNEKVLLVCVAENITFADKHFEQKLGKHPIKLPYVGCSSSKIKEE